MTTNTVRKPSLHVYTVGCQRELALSAVTGLRLLNAPLQSEVNVEIIQASQPARMLIDTDELDEETVIYVMGEQGSALVAVGAGATKSEFADTLNLAAVKTGVTALEVAQGVLLSSSNVGSDAVIELDLLEGDLTNGVLSAFGSDVVAVVNGTRMTGRGNLIEIRTEAVQADFRVAAGFEGLIGPVRLCPSLVDDPG